MANYKIAIDKVLLSEGGYANDPDDIGGETYRGVARKFWAQWVGWLIVDHYKTLPNFPGNLKGIIRLNELVVEFYKVNFWDKVGGDNIKNEKIAELLVDSAVNEGVTPAVKRAQKIVGLAETGHITPELLMQLNSLT